MKNVWIVGIVLILNVSLYAQPTPAKVTRQATKALVERPTLSRYNGVRGGMMGVNYYLQQSATSHIQPATAQRSWLEQQKRNWKARQLYKQRRARNLQAQIQAQELAAREAILNKLPQENPGHQFMTEDFTAFIPAQISVEELPLVVQPGTLYRGLALPADGQAVQNILQNGLRVAEAGVESHTRNLAFSSGMPGAGRALAHTPVTNLTSSPTEAAKWAVKRMTDEKPLIAVVVVNGQTQAGKEVVVAHDIPATQIQHLFVPLTLDETVVKIELAENEVSVTLNETVVWCKVELTEHGAFLITPYDRAPVSH